MEENVSSSEMSEDDERLAIRDELKSLSFEELIKLKQEIGAKEYDKSVFKSSKSTEDGYERPKRKVFSRSNKNRPREESSKVPVKTFVKKVADNVAIQARDPRFDSLCGEFNETAFKNNYSFINDIKDKELKKLEKLYKKEKNSEEKSKIKMVINRMKNQKRSLEINEEKVKAKKSEREKNIKLIKEGKIPQFRRKGETKALNLIDKYEKLKAEGKLEKYLKKKNKHQSKKPNFTGS